MPRPLTLLPPLVFSLALLAGAPLAVGADAPEARHLEQARAYSTAGDLRAAMVELKNALQINPESAEARLWLGYVYAELGEGAAAEKELLRARQLGVSAELVAIPLGRALLAQNAGARVLSDVQPLPSLSATDLAEVYGLRGEAYRQLKQPAAAAAEFRTALTIDPNANRALVGLAQMAILDNRLDEGRKLIEQAIAASPTNALAWSMLGDLEHAQRHLREAETAYSKAIANSQAHSAAQLKRAMVYIDMSDYPAARRDLDAVKALAPNHPEVQYALGLMAFRQGQYAEARDAFDQVLRVQPDRLWAVFYQGVTQLALGNLEQAETHLAMFLNAYPQSEPAARMLASVRLQRGQYAAASVLLKQLLALHPDDPELLNRLGRAMIASGDQAGGEAYLRQAVSLQPQSADARLDFAAGLMASGDTTQGLRELEKAVELDPKSGKPDRLLILGYLKAAQFDRATAAAQQLLAKTPDSVDALVLLGVALASQGDQAGARQRFEQALALRPGTPAAATNLAALDLQAGNIERARDWYEQILRQDPKHAATLLNLARLEARQGNAAGYAQYLEAATEAAPDALEPRLLLARLQLQQREPLKALATLDSLREKNPDNPDLLRALGDAQLAAGQTTNALWSFKKLAEREPRSAIPYYGLAATYAADGNAAGMRENLLRALALEPGHPLAASLVARLVGLARSPAEAHETMQALYQAQPDHPAVIDVQGQWALRQRQPEQALALYREAQRRFPASSFWPLRLAETQWVTGDREGSFATLDAWLKTHPDDAEVRMALANNLLAVGRFDAARPHYEKVVTLAPNSPLALNNLAWLLRDTNPTLARDYAERAMAIAPDANILDTLGEILIRTGDTGRAVTVLRQAASQQPDAPAVHYHLALALARDGKKAEALEMLRKVLAAPAGFEERAAAEGLLKELGG